MVLFLLLAFAGCLQDFQGFGIPLFPYEQFCAEELYLAVVLVGDGIANLMRTLHVVMEHFLS